MEVSQGMVLMLYMVLRLCGSANRRSSNASNEGSLRENMAKADIRVSASECCTVPGRWSLIFLNPARIVAKRASAFRCLRSLIFSFLAGLHNCRDLVRHGRLLVSYCFSYKKAKITISLICQGKIEFHR